LDTTIHNPVGTFNGVRSGHWEIKEDEFECNEAQKIGEGAMAVICKAKLRGMPCVAKKLKTGTQINSQAYKDLVMELDILCSVGKHPNLVEFYGACISNPEKPILFEEFVDGPNVEAFFQRNQGFKLKRKTIYSWSLDIIQALDFLHNRNPIIIHRDLKPANLILNRGMDRVKLADFGMSKKVDQQANGNIQHKGHTGTRRYMAPEVVGVAVSNYTEKADIYSAGLIIWYIACGQRPPIDSRPNVGSVEWAQLSQLVGKMIEQDAKARPSAQECINTLANMPERPDISDPTDVAPKVGGACQCVVQ